MIDLTARALFEELLIFQVEDEIIDLHNDFSCESIKYDSKKQQLKLLFKGKQRVTVEFKGAVIEMLNMISGEIADRETLNNFYRGRFEINGKLFEYSAEGKGYYYLDFEAGGALELFALGAELYCEK